jgi:hypothetical protein
MGLGLFRISFALLLNRSSVNDKVIAYFKLPIPPHRVMEKSVRSLADDPCLRFRKHTPRSGSTGG